MHEQMMHDSLERATHKGKFTHRRAVNYRAFFTVMSRYDEEEGTFKMLPPKLREQRMARLLAAIVEHLHGEQEWDDAKLDEVLMGCVTEIDADHDVYKGCDKIPHEAV